MKTAIDRRTIEIRLIHAMRRELALHEDSYRAIVGRIAKGRTDSSADLGDAERESLIQELRRLGAGAKKASKTGAKPGHRRHTGRAAEPQAAKIRALWIALWNLGAVDSPADAAIDAFVKRQTGLEFLSWLDAGPAFRVIEALKAWCKREGFDVPALGLDAKRELIRVQRRKLGEQPDSEADLAGTDGRRLDDLAGVCGRIIRASKGKRADG